MTEVDTPLMWKIHKIVATRCHILRLKCPKFNFGWGSAPDPAGGAYNAPPDSLAEFKGPTSKGREGRGGEGEGRAGKGKGRKGEGPLVLAYTPLRVGSHWAAAAQRQSAKPV